MGVSSVEQKAFPRRPNACKHTAAQDNDYNCPCRDSIHLNVVLTTSSRFSRWSGNNFVCSSNFKLESSYDNSTFRTIYRREWYAPCLLVA